MKILILNWRDIKHPLHGGAEISLFEHAKYWVRQGASVVWFASSFKGAAEKEKIEGINIVRRGSHYTVHLFAFWYLVISRKKKPDIIIDCFHFIPFFTPLYIKNSKIVGLINEIAGRVWFLNLFLPLAIIGYWLERYSFVFYKKKDFITSSNSTVNELINFNIPKQNIHLIPHGVTIERVDRKIKKEKVPTVIFLGRISKDKGIEDAILAISDIIHSTCSGQKSKIKFWVVGRGESDRYAMIVKKMVKQYDIDKLTTFFGYVNEKKKFELLKRAWILIHPSKKEGWGLTVIEAASHGTPTVGYNVEGLRDSVVNGKTGLLVDLRPKKLADGIIKLILDPNLYSKMSKAGSKWSNKFSWKKSCRMSWNFIWKKS